jgi:hypothetical protein
MRGQRAVFLGAFGVAVATALACNALNGSGDLTIEDEAGTAPTDTATGTLPPALPPPTPPGEPPPDPPAPPPTCTCVEPPPKDWQGPVLFLEKTGAVVSCPTGLVSILDGGANPSAAGTGCTPCTCGSALNPCVTGTIDIFTDNNCTASCKSKALQGPTCVSYGNCQATESASVALDPSSAAPGGLQGCPADGGAKTAAGWGSVAAACAFVTTPSGNCPETTTCAPKSAGAPTAKTCIVHDGDVACPAGSAYAKQVQYDTQLVDTRVCAACQCAAPQGACVGGVVTVYSSNTCTNGTEVETVGSVSSCKGYATGPAGSAKITTPATLDGGCAPQGGGLAGGAVSSSGTATICCMP